MKFSRLIGEVDNSKCEIKGINDQEGHRVMVSSSYSNLFRKSVCLHVISGEIIFGLFVFFFWTGIRMSPIQNTTYLSKHFLVLWLFVSPDILYYYDSITFDKDSFTWLSLSSWWRFYTYQIAWHYYLMFLSEHLLFG